MLKIALTPIRDVWHINILSLIGVKAILSTKLHAKQSLLKYYVLCMMVIFQMEMVATRPPAVIIIILHENLIQNRKKTQTQQNLRAFKILDVYAYTTFPHGRSHTYLHTYVHIRFMYIEYVPLNFSVFICTACVY